MDRTWDLACVADGLTHVESSAASALTRSQSGQLTRSGLDRGLLTNRLILIGFAIEIVFSWAVLYFPPACDVFGTGPVSLEMYAMAWLGAPLIFAADYLRKVAARRRGNS